MKISNTPLATRLSARLLLVAGLGLGAVAAHAAPGFTVQPQDESKIQVGMTKDEVRAALGRPEQAHRYVLSNSSTWTYNVPAADDEKYQIDFDAQGHVTDSGQVMDMRGR
jgi:outer membrane protein assembly factor BamE (lipoprotein component of BamABCDE complex)